MNCNATSDTTQDEANRQKAMDSSGWQAPLLATPAAPIAALDGFLLTRSPKLRTLYRRLSGEFEFSRAPSQTNPNTSRDADPRSRAFYRAKSGWSV